MNKKEEIYLNETYHITDNDSKDKKKEKNRQSNISTTTLSSRKPPSFRSFNTNKKEEIHLNETYHTITIRKKNERKEQAMEYFNDCFNISRTIKTIRKHLSTSSSRISSAIDGKVAWKFSRKRCNYEAKKRVRE